MVKMINREELLNMICTGRDIKIVDVLDREHYDREHIKGAVNIPVDEIERLAPRLFKKDDTIVVYCASFTCPASTRAAEKLISMGFKNVMDFKGGIENYREMNWPLEGSLHKDESRVFPCVV